MTTPTLSDTTWQALSDEYRHGRHMPHGQDHMVALANAKALGDYLEPLVDVACDIASGDTCLRHHGRSWRADLTNPDPYHSLDELLFDWRTHLDMRVRCITTDHPGWDEITRYRYQVWHDTAHAETGFDFTRYGELQLFQHHASVIRLNADYAGLAQRAIDGLWAEMVYPLCTAVVHGQYDPVHTLRTPGPVARALIDVLAPR
jgi:hypothetical protein